MQILYTANQSLNIVGKIQVRSHIIPCNVVPQRRQTKDIGRLCQRLLSGTAFVATFQTIELLCGEKKQDSTV